MPDYAGGNQPPLDQNNGVSIYNTGSQGAPSEGGNSYPNQAQPGQNSDGSWQRAANGEQQPIQYNTPAPYTGAQSIPNSAPPQQSPNQGKSSAQQGSQESPSQPQQSPGQGDQGDENGDEKLRRGKCFQASDPNTPVAKGIMGRPVPGPETTSQGQLGDCWLMATIMGFQVSEKGREGLSKLVVSKGDGYDVIFGSLCGSQSVYVDKVYSSGAQEMVSPTWNDAGLGSAQSVRQGLVSIIESATSQGWLGKLQMCRGSTLWLAEDLLSGGDGEYHMNTAAPWDHKMQDRLTRDADEVNKMIQNGQSVTVGTDDTSQFETTYRINGKLSPGHAVTVVGNHAYAVTAVQNDGIWVRNPWGLGNSADHGNEFWVPKAQIEHSFNDMAISTPISEALANNRVPCTL
ncbi:MAG: C2 family cysteine protease [Mycobacterium sp.]